MQVMKQIDVSRVDLNLLTAFEILYQECSVSAAAERMFIGQPNRCFKKIIADAPDTQVRFITVNRSNAYELLKNGKLVHSNDFFDWRSALKWNVSRHPERSSGSDFYALPAHCRLTASLLKPTSVLRQSNSYDVLNIALGHWLNSLLLIPIPSSKHELPSSPK